MTTQAAFFRLTDDKRVPGRWYLKAPLAGRTPVNPRLFTDEPTRIEMREPLVLPLRRPGHALDWTEADHGMPVASAKVADILRQVAPGDVQMIPLAVESSKEPFFIVNALKTADCIDEQRSVDVRRFTEGGFRPDLAGKFEVIGKLIVDPSRTGGHRIFRVTGWEVALVVSEEIRRAFEHEGVTGALFTPVT